MTIPSAESGTTCSRMTCQITVKPIPIMVVQRARRLMDQATGLIGAPAASVWPMRWLICAAFCASPMDEPM